MCKNYEELTNLIKVNEGKRFHIDYLFKINRKRLWFYSDSFYTWVPVKLSDLNTFEMLAIIEVLKLMEVLTDE